MRLLGDVMLALCVSQEIPNLALVAGCSGVPGVLVVSAMTICGFAIARSVLRVGCTYRLPRLDHSASRGTKRFAYDFQSDEDATARSPVNDARHRPSKTGVPRPQRHETELTNLLSQHAGARNLRAVAQALEEMEVRRGISSMSDYALIIKFAAKHADAGMAHEWLRRAVAAGHVPDRPTFHVVISSYAQQVNVKLAVRVVCRMTDLGVEFNTTTYNLIIEAYQRAGDALSAQMWLKQLIASQVPATAASFGLVLDACATAGLVAELEDWYLVSQNMAVRLNQKWLACVVSALARRNELVQAMKWLNRTVDLGVKPRPDCTSTLLSSILSNGDIDLAAALMERMRAAGMQPDGYCFSKCVAVAAFLGRNTLAQGWAAECAACNCRLSSGAQRALVRAGLQVPKAPQTANGQTDGHAWQGDAMAWGQTPDINQVWPADIAAEVKILDASQVRNASGPLSGDVRAHVMACLGKTFIGMIRELKQGKFGFIECGDTFKLFHSDIYMGGGDNCASLKAGQRVTFTLRIDPDVGMPRAFDVKALRGPALLKRQM